MELYNLIYGDKTASDATERLISRISEYVKEMDQYDPHAHDQLLLDVHAIANGKHYNEHFGTIRVALLLNIRGQFGSGLPFSLDEVEEAYHNTDSIDRYTLWDFIVTLCYMYKLHAALLLNWFPSHECFAHLKELAISFLSDPDDDCKIWRALEHGE